VKEFLFEWLVLFLTLIGICGAAALMPWLAENYPKIGFVYALAITSLLLLVFAKGCAGDF